MPMPQCIIDNIFCVILLVLRNYFVITISLVSWLDFWIIIVFFFFIILSSHFSLWLMGTYFLLAFVNSININVVIRCTVRDSLKFMNSVYSSFVNILFVIYGLIRFTNEMICRLSLKNMNKIKYESKVWVNILVCSVLRKTIRIRFKTTNFVENNRKHSH